MEYVFPNQGFELQNDQFMVGNALLVAPKIDNETAMRMANSPKGKWKSDEGKVYKGGKAYQIEAPLERLPYFEKIK
jgi:alpha-glucosidase